MSGSAQKQVRKGSCACGAVNYVVQSLQPIWYCHCKQCRNLTGHYMAAAQVALDQIEISGEVKWYHVNKRSRHGFCPNCGSQLFWRNEENQYMSVTGGSLDDSSGLGDRGHIFVCEKGGYYELSADDVQSMTWPES